MKRNRPVIVIRRSCLTGKVVWIYKGSSKGAAYTAYCRACKREVERMRRWGETTAERRANILRVLNDFLADIPLNAKLSPEQKAAVKKLQQLSKEDIACHREFYEHIMEERRRRREANYIRRHGRSPSSSSV